MGQKLGSNTFLAPIELTIVPLIVVFSHLIKVIKCIEACDTTVLARFSCLCILGSSLSVHACHPCGALPVY